jgi:hypothetical protein
MYSEKHESGKVQGALPRPAHEQQKQASAKASKSKSKITITKTTLGTGPLPSRDRSPPTSGNRAAEKERPRGNFIVTMANIAREHGKTNLLSLENDTVRRVCF